MSPKYTDPEESERYWDAKIVEMRAQVAQLEAERDERARRYDDQVRHLNARIGQLLDTAKREGMELSRDGYGRNARAEAAEAANAELREALRKLVQVNEEWNASVAAIIGRPPNWTDGYLDEARALLSGERKP